MKLDFLCIHNNKLDNYTLQLTVTVSHRCHFYHFVTNSWLLRTDTQTHLMSCMCVSGGASKGLMLQVR